MPQVLPALGRQQRSSATPLALAWVALVLYASLYPFTGWRWPPGLGLTDLLRLPWPPWAIAVDVAFNVAGYAPLGGLLLLALRRSGVAMVWAVLLALALPAAISYATEVTQQFLPGRHPSLKDLAANAGGAALGVGLALVAQASGLLGAWQRARELWFLRDSAGALALLALWPLTLLFPAPVPLGLGQGLVHLRELLALSLAGVDWAQQLYVLLAVEPTLAPLDPLREALITAMGLLAPCLVAYSVARPGWRRLGLACGALALGFSGMTLSTALNYGPEHALAWLTPYAVPGLVIGMIAALLLAPLPRRLVAGVGLMVLTALVAAVMQAPEDPYFAQSLLAWEQGRFVRFHGVAQWLGWLWPFAAMAWMFGRLARRDNPR